MPSTNSHVFLPCIHHNIATLVCYVPMKLASKPNAPRPPITNPNTTKHSTLATPIVEHSKYTLTPHPDSPQKYPHLQSSPHIAISDLMLATTKISPTPQKSPHIKPPHAWHHQNSKLQSAPLHKAANIGLNTPHYHITTQRCLTPQSSLQRPGIALHRHSQGATTNQITRFNNKIK